MSYLKVGDLVLPEDPEEARKNSNWNPQGNLTVVGVHQGKRSKEIIITAVDERGDKFCAIDVAFKKVSEQAVKGAKT